MLQKIRLYYGIVLPSVAALALTLWGFVSHNWATIAPAIVAVISALWSFGSALYTKKRETELRMQEETHKNRLEKDFTDYKAGLEQFAFQNQMRFSMVHTKRVEFGAELFEKLLKSWMTLGRLQMERDKQEAILNEFKDVSKEAYHLNLRSRFYFPKGIANLLQNFILELHKASEEAEWSVRHNEGFEKFSAQLTKCENRLSQIADFFQKYLFTGFEEEEEE